MKSVLFICTHNSARSQMAEAILGMMHGKDFVARSAGTTPGRVNPHAIQVMKEIGLDISASRSKSLEEFRGETFDHVVTVCDSAKEACPFFPGKNIIHRSFPDPSGVIGTEDEMLQAFRNSRDEIRNWIDKEFVPNMKMAKER